MSAWKADALPLGDARFYPRELDFTVMVKSGQAYLRAPAYASKPHTNEYRIRMNAAYAGMPHMNYAQTGVCQFALQTPTWGRYPYLPISQLLSSHFLSRLPRPGNLCRAGFHTKNTYVGQVSLPACVLNGLPKTSADRDIRPTNSIGQVSILQTPT